MVLWIFGYGSLIWTPDFRYEERVTGYIKDFERVFAPAGCCNHHPPGRAGLRLTLQPQEGAITGGVAYRVTADVEHQILSSHLEERLSTSSTSRMLEFFTGQEASGTAATMRALTYITPPENSNLWYIVLQLNPVVATHDHSDRESAAGSHSAKMMSSKIKGRSSSANGISSEGHWKRDRAWFESQWNSATC